MEEEVTSAVTLYSLEEKEDGSYIVRNSMGEFFSLTKLNPKTQDKWTNEEEIQILIDQIIADGTCAWCTEEIETTGV